MAGALRMWAHVLHHHHGRLRRVSEASVQLVEADASTALGGAINRARDGVADHRRQLRIDTANILADKALGTGAKVKCLDRVGDPRAIDQAQTRKLIPIK